MNPCRRKNWLWAHRTRAAAASGMTRARIIPLAWCAGCALALLGPSIAPARGQRTPSTPARPRVGTPAIGRPGVMSDADLERLQDEGWTAHDRGDFSAADRIAARGLEEAQRAGNRGAVCEMLTLLGADREDREPYDHAGALQYFARALALAQKAGDARRQAKVLRCYGVMYRRERDLPRAVESFRRSVALFEAALGQSSNQAGTGGLSYQASSLEHSERLVAQRGLTWSLQKLGGVLLETARYAEAGACLHRALGVAQRLGDLKREASCLSFLGALHARQGDTREALSCSARSLAIFEKLGDKIGQAMTASDVAQSTYELEGARAALPLMTRALALNETVGRQEWVSRTLLSLSMVLHELGRAAETLGYLERAERISERLGEPDQLVDELRFHANTYVIIGCPDKALPIAARALSLAEQQRDALEVCLCYEQMAECQEWLGHWEEARTWASRFVASAERCGESTLLIDALTDAGASYLAMGDLDKAIVCQERALAATARWSVRERGEWQLNAKKARVLEQIAVVYDYLGDFRAALDYQTRALAFAEKSGSWTADLPFQLNQTGLCFLAASRPRDARDCYARALRLAERDGRSEDAVRALCLMGSAYLSLGRKADARAALQRSLRLAEQARFQLAAADALLDLGEMCILEGNCQAALDYTLRGRRIAETASALSPIEVAGRLAESDRTLAALYMRLGRLSDALAAVQEAAGHWDGMLEQAPSPQEATRLLADQADLHSLHARLLVAMGRDGDALLASERGRARALASAMAGTRADLGKIISPEDAGRLGAATKERADADSLMRVARSVAARASGPDRSAAQLRLDSAQAHARDAESGLRLLRDSLYAKYPAYRRLRAGEPPSLQQIMDLAHRHPDTLYLEWSVGRDTSAILFSVSDRDGLHATVLQPGRTSLAHHAAAWRAAITGQRAEEGRLARGMYSAVLGPLARTGALRSGRYRRLVIVADGPLLELPFAALVDPDGRRLIDRYAVASASSLGTLTWADTPRVSSGPLLCVADPSGSPAERVASALRRGMGPLRHARSEARQVTALFPGAVGLTGPLAREADVKREMGRYAILHFATHGILVPENGLRSWLLLAPEPLQSREDGRLEAREVIGIPLSARLAVLSACDTTRGEPSGGEGLMGLSWAFQAAGCPSVVGSLWSVDDAATAELTTAFYRAAKRGLPLDEALRSAEQAVRRKYPLPFYWAGMQLNGRSDSLPPAVLAPLAAAPAPANHP